MKITNVTCNGTVEDIFNTMTSAKLQCLEEHRMIKLYKTVPLSSSTCERSFSAMRGLKTWLRAKAKANHLNAIMFVLVQKTDLTNWTLIWQQRSLYRETTRGRTILANEPCSRLWRFAFSVQLEIKLSGIYKMVNLNDVNCLVESINVSGANNIILIIISTFH